jgi:hypothetical protein
MSPAAIALWFPQGACMTKHRGAREHASGDASGDAADDEYERDLARDSHHETEPHTMEELAHPGRDPDMPQEERSTGPDMEHGQHARKGQAESSRELTPNQPERKKEGHH